MTDGRLISRRFPYLPVHITVRRGSHQVEALVDTRFDGDVAVPRDLIMNGDPADGHLRWTLADGSTVVAPYYVGSVWLGETELSPVMVIVPGDEPILGRGVIGEFTVILDHGRQVIVEP